MKKIKILFTITIFLFSCGSIKPEKPINEMQETPQISQPISSVVVPIKINLAPYLKETENSIPKKFTGKEENCEGVSFSYTFFRDPIQFKGNKNSLSFEVDGKYALKLNYCPQCTDLFDSKGNCVVPRIYASCGVNEPLRKITVGYSTQLSISPDYKIKSKTDLQKVETIDPCEITVFKYDATKKLKEEITKALENLEKDIDKEIGKVDLKTQAESAWKTLSNPIPLGKYGFLYSNPSKIGLDNLSFNGNYATFDLSIGLNPMLNTNLIEEKKKTELPKLSNFTNKEGFVITLDILASYDSLSSILSKEIKGKEIDIKGKKVIFEQMKIFGSSNNKLNFEIEFSGKKEGVLYLNGTPNFDKEQQVISFPDLEFDVKTKSALLKSAKWLFSDKITDMIRLNTVFDLKPHIETVKTTLNKQINTQIQKGISLKGNIQKVEMENIYPSEKQLIIRINSEGKIYLEM
jgi:hypothetical protein